MVDEAAAVCALQHRIAFDDASGGAGWPTRRCWPLRRTRTSTKRCARGTGGAALHLRLHRQAEGAMQTVGNRFASLRKNCMGRMHAQPGDVLALAGPITHASGMFIQPMLFQGATILLLEGFRPAEYLEASRSTASRWRSWCRR
jgi:hypothetical protein